MIDGRRDLLELLRLAGIPSFEDAIARFALFAHPETVIQTRNKAMFRVIRRPSSQRGEIFTDPSNGQSVMACDNQTPTLTFQIATGIRNCRDVQYNHIYQSSSDVEQYTALSNLCLTPSFLAKLTDQEETVIALLRYRVFDIYGYIPSGTSEPRKPPGYDALPWRPFPDPIRNLSAICLERLRSKPKSRASISARKLGWLFSDFQPDNRL